LFLLDHLFLLHDNGTFEFEFLFHSLMFRLLLAND
jgi:hypothetical protein